MNGLSSERVMIERLRRLDRVRGLAGRRGAF
jgi:hypothetical protein